LNIPPHKVEDIDKTKDSFTYEDFLKLQSENAKELYISSRPIGIQFQNRHDFMFSANPYHAKYADFQELPDNQMLIFENTLLLNYGKLDSNNIYVCLAESIFNHMDEIGKESEQICKLYFPLLYKNGIIDIDSLNENRDEMLRDTRKTINKTTLQYFESVDMFHEIYWRRKIEQPYTKRGITKYSFVLNPTANYLFPLDVIFKTIHATKTAPFIKYNPGSRQENIYRLYYNKITKSGKKIPLLQKGQIMTLSRQIGKQRQISLYIRDASIALSTVVELFLDFNFL
jgi:hypothetical protein